MPLVLKKIEKSQVILIINLLVAAFFVTVLTFKKGYSYVPMTLGIIATLTFLFYRFKLKLKWQFDKEEKYFIFSLIAYFFTFVLSAIFNGDGFREIDNPSRILLLIPLIFFFRLYPIKKSTVFHAIPIGAFIVGTLALYQKFVLNLPKPFPGIMSIQAGDIAITLALFSITISFYWFNKQENKIATLYLIFSMLGLIASILSGARGGWISFPFCFLVILICYRKYLNKKALSLIVVLITVSITFFITNPEFGFQKRYFAAKADIINYLEKGNKHSSQGARLDMWDNALIAISQKPILGHGSTGYEAFKTQQVKSKEMAKTTLKFNSLHNQYLEAFVKRGILGFMGLMAILIIPIAIFIRQLRSNDLALKTISVLGIIHITSHSIFFLTQSYLAHNSGSLFYFFMLILLYHSIKQKESA